MEFEKVPEFFELEWKSLGIDSLDMVELMMELEDDLELGED